MKPYGNGVEPRSQMSLQKPLKFTSQYCVDTKILTTGDRFVKIFPLTFPLSVFPMKATINSSKFYSSKFQECSIHQISSHFSWHRQSFVLYGTPLQVMRVASCWSDHYLVYVYTSNIFVLGEQLYNYYSF